MGFIAIKKQTNPLMRKEFRKIKIRSYSTGAQNQSHVKVALLCILVLWVTNNRKERIKTVCIKLLHCPWQITRQQLQRLWAVKSTGQVFQDKTYQPHISIEVSLFCLVSGLSLCRRCILFIKGYLYSSSYKSHFLPSIVGGGYKKPNSQWHLVAICASVSHCSSNSASET